MNEGTQQSAARKGGAGDRKGSGTLLSRILAYEVRRTTALLAGVFDAGLSSLATFGVGFFAIRTLEPAVLGAYSLVATALFLMGLFPTQLVFTPLEIQALSVSARYRPRLLARTIPLGLAPALLAAVLTPVWVLFAPRTPRDVAIALTITGTICAFASPIQDHIRRVLHLGGVSWAAATVSAVQLAGAGGAILSMSLTGTPAAWIPLGALAGANVLSSLVGLVLAWRVGARGGTPEDFDLSTAVRAGRTLVLVAFMPASAEFLAAAVVSHVAGAAMLGYAEAARVVGQPVWVLATGVAAVMAPQAMAAARERRLGDARRLARRQARLIGAVGILYILIAGYVWPWNPLARLLPNAYALTGMVGLMIVANSVLALSALGHAELLGGRRQTTRLRIEVWGNAVRLAMIAGTKWLGAFAIPAGLIALGLVRRLAIDRALRDYYSEFEGEGEDAAPALLREDPVPRP